MNTSQLRVVGAVLFFVLIFLFGFWLSRSGKPYNGIIYNFHKLIALAAVVLFVITLYRAGRAAALSPAALTAGVVTGLLFLGLCVTGGLWSIEKPMPTIVLRLHQIMPYLTVLSTAVTLYFLLSKS